MTSFDERENAFETEFAHREELKFTVREHAVRLLALWAAQRLGKTNLACEAYASDLAAIDVANPTLDIVLERIAADLHPAGITQQEVRRVMDKRLVQAEVAQVIRVRLCNLQSLAVFPLRASRICPH